MKNFLPLYTIAFLVSVIAFALSLFRSHSDLEVQTGDLLLVAGSVWAWQNEKKRQQTLSN